MGHAKSLAVLSIVALVAAGPASRPTAAPYDQAIRKLDKSLLPAKGQPWKKGDAVDAIKAIAERMTGEAVAAKGGVIEWRNDKAADSFVRMPKITLFGTDWQFTFKCRFTPESREKAKATKDGSNVSIVGRVTSVHGTPISGGMNGAVTLVTFSADLEDVEIR